MAKAALSRYTSYEAFLRDVAWEFKDDKEKLEQFITAVAATSGPKTAEAVLAPPGITSVGIVAGLSAAGVTSGLSAAGIAGTAAAIALLPVVSIAAGVTAVGGLVINLLKSQRDKGLQDMADTLRDIEKRYMTYQELKLSKEDRQKLVDLLFDELTS